MLHNSRQLMQALPAPSVHTESQTNSTRYRTDSISQNLSSPEILKPHYDIVQSIECDPPSVPVSVVPILSDQIEISDSESDSLIDSANKAVNTMRGSSQKRRAEGYADKASTSDMTDGDTKRPRLAGKQQNLSQVREDAYQKMLQNASGTNWHTISLISTSDNHSVLEYEL